MSGESVKVAVRVRPFNQREKDRKATLIIQMQGNMTLIQNPETPKEEPKKFSFDYSYWSHDGYVTGSEGSLEAEEGSVYAGQSKVFDDLGQGVLKNAFQGYNCSLFAYGQTGSGKSYSMVGYGPNKGIVPITCDELFKAMETNADPNIRYEVTFSMLEIYNEQVRDLLDRDTNPKGGLQVRQNPQLGMFYVVNLKRVPVGSYEEIEQRMEQGTSHRTVASTNMNATSSRAHTVVTIAFDQIIRKVDTGQETRKSSIMNLVDLAGSERAASTGATGDRLKEGANINRSLSALGNVISALADLSQGKKKLVVPYRDSILTKLLQNALGGNSKTIMIAALSPADINYEETLSTLRYADRAKKIKNQAVINENPVDKLIRELKEENERLKRKLTGEMDVSSHAQMSPEEISGLRKKMEAEIRAQLLANQEMMNASTAASWEEKLSAARTEAQALARSENQAVNRRTTEPHLVNLNEDPMLSGVLFYFLAGEVTSLGRKDASPLPDVCLSGLSIQKQHAIITNRNGEVDMEPASPGAKVKVNGVPLTGKTTLSHLDRVLFGLNHLYVFVNPRKPQAPGGTPEEISYEFAQREIAQAKGFTTASGSTLTAEQQETQDQILELLPMVSEVNAISEELDKHKAFEIVILSSAALQGSQPTTKTNATHVMVKMKNLLNGNTWLWERGKFMNRRYLIQNKYQQYLEGDEDVFNLQKEDDPFWEPPEDVLIGTGSVFLQSLSYALDFDDKITVTDYKGVQEGVLYVSLTPCTQWGKALDEDHFVEDPSHLLNKPYHFKVSIRSAQIHKARYSRGVAVKYRLPAVGDVEWTHTDMVSGNMSPEFRHVRQVDISSITKEHLDFFNKGSITFCVYGKQEDTEGDPRLAKLTTRELRQREQLSFPEEGETRTRQGVMVVVRGAESPTLAAADHSHMKTEMELMHRKYQRLLQKERRMIKLCDEWLRVPPENQDFHTFYRSVSALAHSTGTRLKTRVYSHTEEPHLTTNGHALTAETEADTVSLFVFGEEESTLAEEAERHNGIVPREKVAHHHFPIDALLTHKQQAEVLALGASHYHRHHHQGQNGHARTSDSVKSSRMCALM